MATIKSYTALDTVIPELKESEDERVRKTLVRFHKSTVDIDGIKGEDIVAWLEKQGEQKTAEWSEDDESHIRYLIECLEYCKKGLALTMSTSTSQEYINWLKSLRHQSRWKPSEEQMKTLNEVINYCANGKEAYLNDYIYNRLIDLRDELNKL